MTFADWLLIYFIGALMLLCYWLWYYTDDGDWK